MGYKDFLSYSLITTTFYSHSINENIKQRLLNLRFNIKENMLCNFLSYFFKTERKESKTTQTSFLIFEINKVNSITTHESSSIKLSKKAKNFIFLKG
jgi:hypothetical protein